MAVACPRDEPALAREEATRWELGGGEGLSYSLKLRPVERRFEVAAQFGTRAVCGTSEALPRRPATVLELSVGV
jgi:hypothetical protein